jgi:uncharacterized membrane protein YoaK (UPF0700 family)
MANESSQEMSCAGSLDVFCVTRLGGPFASLITGNLVQVGGSVVGRDST